MGDEGSAGDPKDNAQNTLSLYGKMLRLDVNNNGDPNSPPNYTYTIPASNPFVGNAAYRPEIWALGFRNPWRWSFDRLTGDIFVGDVGNLVWEEVDFLPSGVGGLNFGWDDREGAHCFEPESGCLTAGRIDPILEYGHDFGCAVTGGYRYRGASNPALQGIYIYADFCSGRIWKGIRQQNGTWTSVEALDTGYNLVSFGEDESGELYVVGSGYVFRIMTTPPPTAIPPPCSKALRPRVLVQATNIGTNPTRLRTVVTATTNSGTPTNALQSIAFTRVDNAFVTIGSQVNRDTPFSVNLTSGMLTTQFTVRRKSPGVAMHVDVSVVDACGAWTSFVGAGGTAP